MRGFNLMGLNLRAPIRHPADAGFRPDESQSEGLVVLPERSGDPDRNLALSEQRAKAVRQYLLAHGISGERVLLNYTGSRYSTGAGAADRRVSLDWIR